MNPTFGDKKSGQLPASEKLSPYAQRLDRALSAKPFPPLLGPLVCKLCGDTGQHVRTCVRNIEDSSRGPGGFKAFPACVDVQDCRDRREAQGKSWPLIDASKSSLWGG